MPYMHQLADVPCCTTVRPGDSTSLPGHAQDTQALLFINRLQTPAFAECAPALQPAVAHLQIVQ